MLKITDVRIGNLVQDELCEKRFDLKIDDLDNLKKLNPISITREELESLGFEREEMIDEDDDVYFLYSRLFLGDEQLYTIVSSNDINFELADPIEIKEIYYIHQIQNIYYSIENKELKNKN